MRPTGRHRPPPKAMGGHQICEHCHLRCPHPGIGRSCAFCCCMRWVAVAGRRSVLKSPGKRPLLARTGQRGSGATQRRADRRLWLAALRYCVLCLPSGTASTEGSGVGRSVLRCIAKRRACPSSATEARSHKMCRNSAGGIFGILPFYPHHTLLPHLHATTVP